eukprot:PhF_6_TR10575/c1_g1_i3/m.16861
MNRSDYVFEDSTDTDDDTNNSPIVIGKRVINIGSPIKGGTPKIGGGGIVSETHTPTANSTTQPASPVAQPPPPPAPPSNHHQSVDIFAEDDALVRPKLTVSKEEEADNARRIKEAEDVCRQAAEIRRLREIEMKMRLEEEEERKKSELETLRRQASDARKLREAELRSLAAEEDRKKNEAQEFLRQSEQQRNQNSKLPLPRGPPPMTRVPPSSGNSFSALPPDTQSAFVGKKVPPPPSARPVIPTTTTDSGPSSPTRVMPKGPPPKIPQQQQPTTMIMSERLPPPPPPSSHPTIPAPSPKIERKATPPPILTLVVPGSERIEKNPNSVITTGVSPTTQQPQHYEMTTSNNDLPPSVTPTSTTVQTKDSPEPQQPQLLNSSIPSTGEKKPWQIGAFRPSTVPADEVKPLEPKPWEKRRGAETTTTNTATSENLPEENVALLPRRYVSDPTLTHHESYNEKTVRGRPMDSQSPRHRVTQQHEYSSGKPMRSPMPPPEPSPPPAPSHNDTNNNLRGGPSFVIPETGSSMVVVFHNNEGQQQIVLDALKSHIIPPQSIPREPSPPPASSPIPSAPQPATKIVVEVPIIQHTVGTQCVGNETGTQVTPPATPPLEPLHALSMQELIQRFPQLMVNPTPQRVPRPAAVPPVTVQPHPLNNQAESVIPTTEVPRKPLVDEDKPPENDKPQVAAVSSQRADIPEREPTPPPQQEVVRASQDELCYSHHFRSRKPSQIETVNPKQQTELTVNFANQMDKYMHEHPHAPTEERRPIPQNPRLIFVRADVNADGFVNLTDIEHAFHASAIPFDPYHLASAFDTADKRQLAKLDYDGFLLVLKELNVASEKVAMPATMPKPVPKKAALDTRGINIVRTPRSPSPPNSGGGVFKVKSIGRPDMSPTYHRTRSYTPQHGQASASSRRRNVSVSKGGTFKSHIPLKAPNLLALFARADHNCDSYVSAEDIYNMTTFVGYKFSKKAVQAAFKFEEPRWATVAFEQFSKIMKTLLATVDTQMRSPSPEFPYMGVDPATPMEVYATAPQPQRASMAPPLSPPRTMQQLPPPPPPPQSLRRGGGLMPPPVDDVVTDSPTTGVEQSQSQQPTNPSVPQHMSPPPIVNKMMEKQMTQVLSQMNQLRTMYDTQATHLLDLETKLQKEKSLRKQLQQNSKKVNQGQELLKAVIEIESQKAHVMKHVDPVDVPSNTTHFVENTGASSNSIFNTPPSRPPLPTANVAVGGNGAKVRSTSLSSAQAAIQAAKKATATQ